MTFIGMVICLQVLFKHLQEKLLLTESKLKEPEYQLAPWQSDVNHSNDSHLAPSRAAGVALTHSVCSYSSVLFHKLE